MNYVESLNLFGVEAKEIPCIKGSGAPTESTVGAVGLLYMDTDTGDMYKCTAVTDGVYTWGLVGGGTSDTYYYESFSEAISDINNDTTDNSVVDISSAKVKKFIADNGKPTIALIDDVYESTQIDINKDVDIALNGSTLYMTSPVAHLRFAEGIACTIDGQIHGSSIVKECDASDYESSGYCMYNLADELIINGGQYMLITTSSRINNLIYSAMGSNNVILKNCSLNATNNNSSSAKDIRNITSDAKKLEVINCSLTVSGNKACCMSIFTGNALISETTISTTTANNQGFGLSLGESATVKLVDSNVSVLTDTGITAGVFITANNTLYTVDSTIFVDAPDYTTRAYGIVNLGDAHVNNTNITAIIAGIENVGKVYVNGGILTGYRYGGFHFDMGESGVAYINDATVRCGNYEGIYDYSDKTDGIMGCIYVGTGPDGASSNSTIYLDGCVVGDGGGDALILCGESGELNNTVNISNTTLTDAAGIIRIDNSTHKVNIGIGTNITTTNINMPSCAEFTDAFYRKNHADKICDGNDFNALINYMTSMPSNAVTYTNVEGVLY